MEGGKEKMSLLGKLIPLILLFLGIAVAGVIGFVVYAIVSDIAEKTNAKMEKKNVRFGKEGMRIGVREIRNENYVDRTQRWVEFYCCCFFFPFIFFGEEGGGLFPAKGGGRGVVLMLVKEEEEEE